MKVVQLFMMIVGIVFGLSVMSYTHASGGKVGKQDVSPIYSEDQQPTGLVVPLPEGCEAAVLQSQVVVFCSGEDND